MNPLPASKAFDAVRLGSKGREFEFNRGEFVLNGAIDEAFNFVTQVLENSFSWIEFRGVGRLLNAQDVNIGIGRTTMPTGAVLNQALNLVCGPLFDNGGDGSGLHVLTPLPQKIATHTVDGQIEIGVVILVLDFLNDFDAA